jgi:hypothetical protein
MSADNADYALAISGFSFQLVSILDNFPLSVFQFSGLPPASFPLFAPVEESFRVFGGLTTWPSVSTRGKKILGVLAVKTVSNYFLTFLLHHLTSVFVL